MTEKQKIGNFTHGLRGKDRIEQLAEFIANPNIKAISIAATTSDLILLYEEL